MTLEERRPLRLPHTLVCWLALISLALAAFVTSTSPTASAAETEPSDKIQSDLAAQLESKGDSPFWIRFGASADLSGPSAIADWDARGAAVAAALRATAAGSQGKVKAELDSAGVTYKAFWATNAIYVEKGSIDLALSVAARPEVAGLYNPVKYEIPKVTPAEGDHAPNVVEWGIDNINADDVWDQFGVTGEGVVVANIDTGVQFDHPALVNQYRGNNGDGTFDHNYNWFDAAGVCGDEPCDGNGHGTHTMGTMAGDDGAGNQIGVAPGVQWIAANGCCPSDTALIESGEWLLEPTDLNGENPDASMRPDIINNSWGTTAPSNDPFMEDISLAWTASGIFGAWANGNIGPSCQTSGSPGSRIINYSVGAYDINNTIAGFSSRGAGQDGETKPNISAPGVNVRSSVPGDGYANFNGTSMATPHVAGAIALVWAAAPALHGDVDGTKALLDGTATDNPDAQCGGTDADNNVYGEGRLDALALAQAAPVGDTGTLQGTVTRASNGAPIADATVDIVGPIERTLTTGDDGTYSARLSAGDYTVTVSKFGFGAQTADVTIVAEETLTQDFALAALARVRVDGRITDGSGQGWPLYAKVSVVGAPEVFDYTVPQSGRYVLRLPVNSTHTLSVETVYPGYETVESEVVVAGSAVTHDIQVPVSPADCSGAPGYVFGSDGVYETFDSDSTPDGWSVVDNLGNGQVWAFDDPGNRGNITGGTGGFAIVDSDFYGPGNSQDTSLVSPVVDLTAVAEPVVRFNQNYDALGDIADVDLSVDGGATWTNILNQTLDIQGEMTVPIPQAAGEPDVQVRFHYYEASFAWWWAVDNVLIGSEVTCEPTDGGLVWGVVRNLNNNEPVNGATVRSNAEPNDSGITMATPDDTGQPDGFYWLFSSLTGRRQFTASASNYQPASRAINVPNHGVRRGDFTLAAGHLVVEPTSLEADVPMGGEATGQFTVTNDGTASADLEFSERSGDFVILRADGTEMTSEEIAAHNGARVKRIAGDFSPLSHANQKESTGSTPRAASRPAPSAPPWTDITDYPTNIMDNVLDLFEGNVYSVAGFDGADITGASFVYDPAAQTWSPIADLPEGRENPMGAFIDGKMYVSGGWAPSGAFMATTYAYDPAADTWTQVADGPVAAAAGGRAVLDGQLYLIGGCQNACGLTDVRRYDPASDTWTTLADYPEATSHVACGGLDGLVICAGGTAGAASANSYAYDPAADSWTPRADVPTDVWGMASAAANGQLLLSGGIAGGAVTNEGWVYDPAADSWTDLPAANTTSYRMGSGCGLYRTGGALGLFDPRPDAEVLPGFEECGVAADVPWLAIDTTTATLAPGESVTVTVTMTADVAQPGAYTAGVGIKENTPEVVAPVDVTMNALPPATWGKLTGVVNGRACDGSTGPLGGVTVAIDSWAAEITLTTGTDGSYAHWLDERNNPLSMIVAKDGWRPQARTTEVTGGGTTTENFTLRRVSC
jgi:subtilisin family serine protease/N-acetylneuraminic acid mutarotase